MSQARRRGPWLWLAVAGAILLTVLIVGPPRNEGPPLDPDGVGPLGTRALVLLVEELGGEVEVSGRPPDGDDDVALVLVDDLGDERRADVERWVADGGTLVVADPGSELNPARVAQSAARFDLLESTVANDCDLEVFEGVDRVDPSGGLLYDEGAGVGCFGRETGSFVVVTTTGEGTTVSVGGAGAFTNAVIGNDDNGAFAAALLVPERGARVRFLRPPAAAAGERSLIDLMAPNVKQSLLQLGVAFLVYAAWRARRLGRPVVEHQPVELAGSELVVAVGNLLQQARQRDRAATLLRDDVRRHLGERLGLGPSAPAVAVAEVAAARTGIPVGRLLDLLTPQPVADDENLLALSQAVEALRIEVLHAR